MLGVRTLSGFSFWVVVGIWGLVGLGGSAFGVQRLSV